MDQSDEHDKERINPLDMPSLDFDSCFPKLVATINDYYRVADCEGFLKEFEKSKDHEDKEKELTMKDFYNNVNKNVHGLFREELRQQLP